MNSVKDAIKSRRSVRTFKDRPLLKDDIDQINQIIKDLKNPFGIPVEFKILDAKENNLKSPVISGADTYIATKVSPTDLWEVAYGYTIEELCLLLEEMGIGTTIIAGTFNRDAFEKAMDLQDDEVMPAATPIGYPADKLSMRERLMRKAVKADERIPFNEIVYLKDFSHPLPKEDAGIFSEALDLMRLAPSAVNKQPWRAVVDEDTVHFYKDKTKKLADHELGDVQKVDVGIGIANFDLVMKENGTKGEFFVQEPENISDETKEYLVSYKISD